MRNISTCTKICEMCNQEFQAKSRLKRFCDRPHYATCCICGKVFELPNNNLSYYLSKLDHVTCGGECKGKLANQNLKPGERAKQIKQGMQKRHGVDNPGQLRSTITKREQTNIAKYGDGCPLNNPDVRARQIAKCQEKYSTDYVTQTQEFKDKSKATCQRKYNKDYVTQVKEFQDKAKASLLERTGYEHALQCPTTKQKRVETYRQKWGANHPMQTPEGIALMRAGIAKNHGGDAYFSNPEKRKQTCLEEYGTEYYLQSEDCKKKTRETNLRKRGVDHHLKSSEIIKKREKTCMEKYDSPNVFSSEYGMKKCRETMIAKYNAENPSQVPEFKRKATANARNSKLETRIFDLFVNYGIEFVHHYFIQNTDEEASHEFDFYLPKYKILIDADGLYFHSYLSDPNGKQSLDYYDDIRQSLVPSDHQFHVIVEGNEDQQVKQLVKILEQIDSGIFDYDSYLFNWCRSIEFPYPGYTDKRLSTDWSSLCKYQNVKYVPACRLGESIIKQFHRSIFNCIVKKGISPIDAWYDDNLLKKVIKNRLIYVNDVDPSKILRGFNVSKICPVVSIFNPVLAKYLISTYLAEFSIIFDPFSGFSGRLLGAASLGKKYIGQDLNSIAVAESNQIINYLNLAESCKITEKDIFQSSGQYECLLTCPPYGTKEKYNTETIFKSCDEWIDECLIRFDCQRYVFVVDKTKKYEQFVEMPLKATSHFATGEEKVIVIDRGDIQ